MSKEVPLTQARDVIPLTLKPSSFPRMPSKSGACLWTRILGVR